MLADALRESEGAHSYPWSGRYRESHGGSHQSCNSSQSTVLNHVLRISLLRRSGALLRELLDLLDDLLGGGLEPRRGVARVGDG
jgi:hypothetical protein